MTNTDTTQETPPADTDAEEILRTVIDVLEGLARSARNQLAQSKETS